MTIFSSKLSIVSSVRGGNTGFAVETVKTWLHMTKVLISDFYRVLIGSTSLTLVWFAKYIYRRLDILEIEVVLNPMLWALIWPLWGPAVVENYVQSSVTVLLKSSRKHKIQVSRLNKWCKQHFHCNFVCSAQLVHQVLWRKSWNSTSRRLNLRSTFRLFSTPEARADENLVQPKNFCSRKISHLAQPVTRDIFREVLH